MAIRGRKPKEHIALNIRLAKSVGEKLDKYSCDSGKTKTDIVEEALSMYFGICEREKRIAKEFGISANR